MFEFEFSGITRLKRNLFYLILFMKLGTSYNSITCYILTTWITPFRYPRYAWGLICRKLLRWSVGFFLVGAFFANFLLLNKPFYQLILCFQLLFYSLALTGFFLRAQKKSCPIFSLPFYFCLVNVAAMWGIIQFLSGKKKAVWELVRN